MNPNEHNNRNFNNRNISNNRNINHRSTANRNINHPNVNNRRKRKRRNDYIGGFIKLFLLCAVVALAVLVVFFIVQGNNGSSKTPETSGIERDTLPETEEIDTPATDLPEIVPPVTEPPATAPPETEPPATKAPETEPETNYVYEFKADLSEYEKYMEPENRDEYLILINTSHPLDETYAPDDLIDVVDTRKDGRATQKMREYASKALEAMLIEARANGITDVTATSAYRSFTYQTTLFNQRVAMYSTLSKEEAYAKAATIVAIPGTSEHQSGLCVDIHNNPYGADISFENTASGKWLAENSYKFGFILRFPKDKTEITGISFEPWHFRYVGRYHASKMHELGLCLEEYFKYLGR